MKTLALVLAAAVSAAAAPVVRPTVAVVGRGAVSVAPNIARVTITVTNTAPLTTPVSQIMSENQARVRPSLDYVKEIVGSNGTVTAIPTVAKQTEYDNEKHRNVVTGHSVVTQITVELKGKGAIEQKLGKLFDSSRIDADDISAPTLDLSDASRQAARRRAYGRAVKNARSEAEAQLEAGERLGQAQDRGTGAGLSARGGAKSMARLASASLETADMGGGEPVVETGKITVSAATQFVFEVLGVPARLVRKLSSR